MTEYYFWLGREAEDVTASRALESSLDRWDMLSEYYNSNESKQSQQEQSE